MLYEIKELFRRKKSYTEEERRFLYYYYCGEAIVRFLKEAVDLGQKEMDSNDKPISLEKNAPVSEKSLVNSIEESEEFISTKDAAKMIGTSVGYISTCIRKGLLSGHKIEKGGEVGRYVVLKSQLESLGAKKGREVVDASKAARILGCSEHQVYNAYKDGKIEGFRLFDNTRYKFFYDSLKACKEKVVIRGE
jgi:hypothetical protein